MKSSDILAAVQSWALQQPDAQAIQDEAHALSYAQFIDSIRQVSAALQQLGATPGRPVATYLGNTVAHAVCMYACLSIGCPFVPIPQGSPTARIRHLLADTQPAVFVVPDGEGEDTETPQVRIATYDQLLQADAGAQPEPVAIEPGTPAYVVFTSGSSGTPKGVVVPHESLRTAIVNTVRAFDIHPGTRSLVIASFHFDASFAHIFGVLAGGGALFISSASQLTPVDYLERMALLRITHTGFSPSFLKTLVTALERADGRFLRTAAIGSEDCNKGDIEAFLRAFPNVRMFNRYGPTETTIVVSSFEITPESLQSPSKIPLGKPHAPITDFSSRPWKTAQALLGHREILRGLMAGRLHLQEDAT